MGHFLFCNMFTYSVQKPDIFYCICFSRDRPGFYAVTQIIFSTVYSQTSEISSSLGEEYCTVLKLWTYSVHWSSQTTCTFWKIEQFESWNFVPVKPCGRIVVHKQSSVTHVTCDSSRMGCCHQSDTVLSQSYRVLNLQSKARHLMFLVKIPTLSQKILHLRIITKPVTVGAVATVYVWFQSQICVSNS